MKRIQSGIDTVVVFYVQGSPKVTKSTGKSYVEL